MTRNRDLGDVAPFVDGVSSNIQTQINAKQGTISVTADRALISDGSGALAVSTVTSTQLATVPNLAPIANPTFTGVVTTPQVNVSAQGSVRMEDAAGGEYAAFQAPTTLTASYIMTMPPNTGNAGEFLSTNGSGVLSFAAPAAAGGFASQQIFTSSGTWTKPAGITKIYIRGCGGGGGGAGSRTGYDETAGGGGAGGYFEKLIDVSSVSSVSVTIGAGGTSSDNAAGSAGGDTLFGTYATAYGGGAGKLGYSGYAGGGNASSSGGIEIRGGFGGIGGNPNTSNGGPGGSSPLGNGGPLGNRSLSRNGVDGTGYGGGGSGGFGGGGGQRGGYGSDGIVMIMEYK